MWNTKSNKIQKRPIIHLKQYPASVASSFSCAINHQEPVIGILPLRDLGGAAQVPTSYDTYNAGLRLTASSQELPTKKETRNM